MFAPNIGAKCILPHLNTHPLVPHQAQAYLDSTISSPLPFLLYNLPTIFNELGVSRPPTLAAINSYPKQNEVRNKPLLFEKFILCHIFTLGATCIFHIPIRFPV